MSRKKYASLASSKALFEAGIILDTGMYWVEDDDNNFVLWELKIKSRESYPAPTMYECWSVLPRTVVIRNCMGFFRTIIDSNDNCCCVGYRNEISGFIYCSEKENPADAIIDVLIWHKEYTAEDGRSQKNRD